MHTFWWCRAAPTTARAFCACVIAPKRAPSKIKSTSFIHQRWVRSPWCPPVSLNYGQASILTPSDFPFSRDSILAEGNPNQEMMVIGELNLKTISETRSSGTVLPLLDSRRTAELVSQPEVISL